MQKKFTFITAFLLIFVTPVLAQPIESSGFLGDYSKLQAYPHEPGVFYQTNEKKDFSRFKKVMLTEIDIQFAKELQEDIPITKNQIKQLKDHFRLNTRKFISQHFRIVHEPGPDVLLLRLGFTELVPNDVYFNVDWDSAKPGFALSYGTVEVDFNLSTTGERVFAIVDDRVAKRYEYILDQGSWMHTEDLYIQWSELVAQILKEHYE